MLGSNLGWKSVGLCFITETLKLNTFVEGSASLNRALWTNAAQDSSADEDTSFEGQVDKLAIDNKFGGL